MLHLFLVILKIIGIVFAVIIGLLLLLVLAVLFVPFYYQIEGNYNSLLEEKQASLKGRLSFLGPFLRFQFWYEDVFEWDLKLFFVSLKGFVMKEKKKSKEDLDEDEFLFEKEVASQDRETLADKRMPDHDKNKDVDIQMNETEEENKTDEMFSEEISHRKKTFVQKVFEIKQKIKASFKKIKDMFKKGKEMASVLQELLGDEHFKTAFVYGKEEVLEVLKKIWPHIKFMNIRYGTQDPALTGQILGAVSIMNGITGTTVKMYPDFEAKTAFFDGKGKLKGKIRICYFVKLWYKYKCDKEIKYLKYKFKKVRRSFQ